ncbi:hypothetical protein BDY19DRAFT_903925 [Irpex rosettiformis]|uniref:Uncharacterized protein n=1 Tax=Irpex rosettiformis TaxID=378272 RepID=A0ACB8UCY8_9APHY|nr:hypothetical protein BDY19DRAFT_903925 [Irpex rosettiformis]
MLKCTHSKWAFKLLTTGKPLASDSLRIAAKVRAKTTSEILFSFLNPAHSPRTSLMQQLHGRILHRPRQAWNTKMMREKSHDHNAFILYVKNYANSPSVVWALSLLPETHLVLPFDPYNTVNADGLSRPQYTSRALQEHPMARREEMKHLSACALTCVYWAQLTRQRMFERLVLWSPKDLCGLRPLLRASKNGRLDPIGHFIRVLVVYYKLGDHPWFHSVGGLEASGADELRHVYLHILGPVPPAFTVGDTRRSVSHPLFYAVLRVLPMTSFYKLEVHVSIENIHFTHPAMLFNLLQDCKLLRPWWIFCINLTWDHDSTATPSSIGWTFTHHSNILVDASHCTQSTLAAAMALCVPRHELSLRPHLSLIDASCLVDIMRASQPPNKSDVSTYSVIRSFSGFEEVQRLTAARLAADCDLAFRWELDCISFFCIGSRRPEDESNTRYATYILIQPSTLNLAGFREHFRAIDWVVFLCSVQKFPDLCGVVIQCSRDWDIDDVEWCKCLVELVPLLREAWPEVDAVLQLFHSSDRYDEWTQIELHAMLEGIGRMVSFPDLAGFSTAY